MLMSSPTTLRRVAKAFRIAERFAKIELHPAVYVSFIAINICFAFAYQLSVHNQHSSTVAEASVLPVHGIDLKHESFDLKPKSELLAVKPVEEKPVAKPEAEEKVIEKLETKSSGAALAAVPLKEKSTAPKPKKKISRRMSNGLVPPPPPGVLVIPPPPDAPSFFAGAHATGKHSFLVPPPPPMVLDDSFDYSGSSKSHKTASRRSRHNYASPRDDGRARTVTHGNYQRVIVSR